MAWLMAPAVVIALVLDTANALPVLPALMLYVTASLFGSVALTAPTAVPTAEPSTTLNA